MSKELKGLIHRRPNRIYQYLATITGSLNITTSGMCYGWTSASLPKLLDKDSPIPITNDEGSWIAVTMLCGGICGSVLAGVLLDRLGRKNVILLTSIPFFVSWIIIAFAKSFASLIIARFIAGIPDGLIFCAVPMYLAEIADPEIRGLLGSSITLNWIFGNLLMNIIGSYLSITTGALIAAVVPVLLLLTVSWMPKSPYYLIMKGELDQANRSLKILRGDMDIEQELNRIRKAIEEEISVKSSWGDLFKVRSNRKALFIVMGTRAALQLSGSIAISFYAQIIFKEAGDNFSPIIASIIYFCVSLIFSGVSSVIVDKVGRRPLAIFSVTGSGLALLIEGCYFYIKNSTNIDTSDFTIIPIFSLIVFVMVLNLGLQSMPYLLLSELFPTNVKALVFSLHDIYYCFLCIVVSKFFQVSKDEFGMHVPFFAFAISCGLGLLFAVFCIPETKGKTLEQIQDELKGDDRKPKIVELEKMFQKQ